MPIRDIIQAGHTAISFEFFPPNTEAGSEKLFHTIARLTPLHPAFVSVTYGAGGSTRQRTHDLVARLHTQTDLPVTAHLTCVGSTREEIDHVLARYHQLGIRSILALRGDCPELDARASDFAHAADLVAFIRQRYPDFHIGVAGYPEGHPDSPDRLVEIDHLKAKIDAGADFIITQMFFENRDFYDFSERCEINRIHAPVLAGIMPVTSIKGMHRMAGLARGTRFPAGLLRALHRAHGDQGVKAVGVHWAAEQVRDLIDSGAPGIHLYTLNHSDATLRVCQSLGLQDFANIPNPKHRHPTPSLKN